MSAISKSMPVAIHKRPRQHKTEMSLREKLLRRNAANAYAETKVRQAQDEWIAYLVWAALQGVSAMASDMDFVLANLRAPSDREPSAKRADTVDDIAYRIREALEQWLSIQLQSTDELIISHEVYAHWNASFERMYAGYSDTLGWGSVNENLGAYFLAYIMSILKNHGFIFEIETRNSIAVDTLTIERRS